jgi:hypothetical protein
VVWEKTGAVANSRQANPKSEMPFIPEGIHEPPEKRNYWKHYEGHLKRNESRRARQLISVALVLASIFSLMKSLAIKIKSKSPAPAMAAFQGLSCGLMM